MLQLNTNTTRVEKDNPIPFLMPSPDLENVSELIAENTAEVLDFLSERPVHTVVMSSFIADNGIVSDLNRGKFHGYRNSLGRLEGVALIGHSTLVEARTPDALAALAQTARKSETPIHLIMSGDDDAAAFWKYLCGGQSEPRLTCTEALFEVSFPFAVQRSEWQVENATMQNLLQVAEAQAEVAFMESGVDPMAKDREGFLNRVARRIEQNRVFVVMDGEKLVFKADIIAEASGGVYLEGIYVAPNYRSKSVGSKCLASLTLQLLDRAEHICMLSNVDFTSAHRSFERAGYRRSGQCTTLFV